MVDVTQADREAAASVAVLVEMRELILAGKADHHAEAFARHRIAERARIVAWLREQWRDGDVTIEWFDIAEAIEEGGL